MHSSSPGLLTSLRGFALTAVTLARTRLGLLTLEVQEELARLQRLLMWSIAAVLLGVAGLVFLAVFLTVLLWESHRLLVLGIVAALFLGAATLAVLAVRALVRRGSGLFSASLAELGRDGDALDPAPPPSSQPAP